ncbi:unnamed protein product [Pedinophyceae sp. YPF-701]|nr:unnamed protein product [Pedinophyceae sp. YPF-701]
MSGGNGDPTTARPAVAHVHAGTACVWDASDAVRLRTEHRVLGTMIGGLAALKQQNSVFGLPLQLMPEEAIVGLRKGWLQLAAAPVATPQRAAASGATAPADSSVSSAAEAWAMKHAAALRRGFVVPHTSALVPAGAAPTAEHLFPLYEGGQRAEQFRKRLEVFCDLYDRGYTLTAGVRYGADYLAYPGDPSMYHAQLAVVVADPDQCVPPTRYAGTGRIIHAVRKHFVVAWQAKDGGKVQYLTITPPLAFDAC